jgi:hypothetical protein
MVEIQTKRDRSRSVRAGEHLGYGLLRLVTDQQPETKSTRGPSVVTALRFGSGEPKDHDHQNDNYQNTNDRSDQTSVHGVLLN